MEKNQLVSLIIPNFNKANYLAETLNSILAQSYPIWEAIIVDDGSTDQSREIIKSIVDKDVRFKVFYLEKQLHGGASCRNFGIQNALGEYLMFFDSDDVLLPNCLNNRVAFMNQNPNIDFAVFSMESFFFSLYEK
jgi:glycosyltransferase involved in cell wall biosynthesis